MVAGTFGTMKARMGATHFLTKTLPKGGRMRYMVASDHCNSPNR
jgi:hypothetical protein